MKNTESARGNFAGDLFATQAAGIVIKEAREGYAHCEMEIKPHHKAAHGGVMGGAVFTLADFAFAVASNSEEFMTMTVTSSINYISSPKKGTLTARSRAVKNGRTVCFYETVITGSDGAIVATVTSTGIRRRK